MTRSIKDLEVELTKAYGPPARRAELYKRNVAFLENLRTIERHERVRKYTEFCVQTDALARYMADACSRPYSILGDAR